MATSGHRTVVGISSAPRAIVVRRGAGAATIAPHASPGDQAGRAEQPSSQPDPGDSDTGLMIQQDRPAAAPTLPARAPGSPATPLPRAQRSAGFGQPFVQLLNPRHRLYSVPAAVDPASQPEQVARRAERVTAVDSPSARRRARSHPRLDRRLSAPPTLSSTRTSSKRSVTSPASSPHSQPPTVRQPTNPTRS